MPATTTDGFTDDRTELAWRRASASSKVARIRDVTDEGNPERVKREADLAYALILEHAAKTLRKFGPLRPEQCDRIDAFMRRVAR